MPLIGGIQKACRLTIVAGFAVSFGLSFTQSAAASTRTISFYSLNTGESLTVTYKRNGRYIPSAMKKLNYILRDWRANQPTKMDRKVIDLLWELHEELGSNSPIHLVSGYRSPKTNAMRRRQSRGVAKHSQHMHGRAIDCYFPDVPLKVIRESALIKQRGGVGYYPRSRKPFVHIDTGSVRHWPRMPAAQYAALLKRGNKYISRYASSRRRSSTRVASVRTPKRSARPARFASARLPASVLKNPPLPRRKPVFVAAAAPRGESWLRPTGSIRSTRPSTLTLASSGMIPGQAKPVWSNVKKRMTASADTLMALVKRREAAVRKPVRIAINAQPLAKITSSPMQRVTTASIRRTIRPGVSAQPATVKTAIATQPEKRITTASIMRAPQTSKTSFFQTNAKPAHVWRSDTGSLTDMLRDPVHENLPVFSGPLFASLDMGGFRMQEPQHASAKQDMTKSRRVASNKDKRFSDWVSGLFSGWKFLREANAKDKNAARVAQR